MAISAPAWGCANATDDLARLRLPMNLIVRDRQQGVLIPQRPPTGEWNLHGDFVVAVVGSHLRRQLHGMIRIGDIDHSRAVVKPLTISSSPGAPVNFS